MKAATSSGRSTPMAFALLRRIAVRISNSGGSIATESPLGETRNEARFNVLQAARIGIRRDHELLVVWHERLESSENCP